MKLKPSFKRKSLAFLVAFLFLLTFSLARISSTLSGLVSLKKPRALKLGPNLGSAEITTTSSTFEPRSNFSYVTLLSTDSFLPGTVVLVESLRQQRTLLDIVVMILPHISQKTRQRLFEMDVVIMEVEYVPNPYLKSIVTKRQLHNFAKLRAWQLTCYRRVIFVDSDVLILRNIDHLFQDTPAAEIAAVENYASPLSLSPNTTLFNSGFMLIRPSQQTFVDMVTSFDRISSYNGGDQGFLNNYFNVWVPLNQRYNVNKMLYKYAPERLDKISEISVIHYVRVKPWFEVRFQTEVNENLRLIDTPQDFAQVNQQWKDMQLQANQKYLKMKPPQPSERRCLKGPKASTICLTITRHFCPLGFSYSCPEPQTATSDDLNLVTIISHDRLQRLIDFFKFWTGPVSVAVWVPRDKYDQFLAAFVMSDIPFARADVHLVVQDDVETSFPINFLRNLAIWSSFQDLFMYVDVDFLPSQQLNLLNSRRNDYRFIWDETKRDHVFVIPALQTSWKLCIDPTFDAKQDGCVPFPADKESAISLINAKVLTSFHSWGLGHNATDLERWKITDEIYSVNWQPWYEPYLIARKSRSRYQIFDQDFFDRGRNKLFQSLNLHVRGFEFQVLPQFFLLHQWDKDPKKAHLKKMPRVGELFDSRVRRILKSLNCTELYECHQTTQQPH